MHGILELANLTFTYKERICSRFINYKTHQIDIKSLVSFAQTNKANMLLVGELLGGFLLTDTVTHPDPVIQARENIIKFGQHPEYRKPEWHLCDAKGKDFVFEEVLAGRYDDPVSKILRGEITPAQQTILNSIAASLANPASIFSRPQRKALKSHHIQAYIVSTQLTLEQVLCFKTGASNAFKNKYIRAYITSSQLTIKQVLGISWGATHAFENSYIRDYIAGGKLTIEQVLGIQAGAHIAFGNKYVRDYVASSQLTMQQVLDMTVDASWAFEYQNIRDYIASGLLTAVQVLSITNDVRLAFENSFVQAHIAHGRLTPLQVLNGITIPNEVVDFAPAEALTGAGCGVGSHHSLATPLLDILNSEYATEATVDLDK